MLAAALAAAAFARADAPPAGSGMLHLRNGDRFTGRLEGLDAGTGVLVFRHERLREPVALPLDAVADFRAAPAAGGAAAPEESWSFEMHGGDTVIGRPVALDARALQVETAGMGRMTVVRGALRSALRSGGGRVVYDGPGPASDWPHTVGVVAFEDNAVRLKDRAQAGRVLDAVPHRLWLEFEAEWAPNARLGVQFFGGSPEMQTGQHAFYQFTVNANRIDLTSHLAAAGSRRVGQAAFQPERTEADNLTARFVICADLETRRFEVLINGRLAGSWKDPGEFPTPGPGLSFASVLNGAVTVRHLRVREWSGRLAVPEESAAPSGIVIRLANGDTVNGEELAFADGTARVRTAFGDITVPLDRLAQARFPGPAAEAGFPPGAARFHLRDGAVLTMVPESLADGVIAGSSERYGRVRVPLSALLRLQWVEAAPAARR